MSGLGKHLRSAKTPLFHFQQQLPFIHGHALLYLHRFYLAFSGGFQHIFHFHGFEYQQRVTFLHHLAGRYQNIQYQARHGRFYGILFLVAAEMQAGHFNRVRADAIAPAAAGAHILHVNAGLGVANPHEVEPEVLTEAIRIVQEVVDVPISIDSSVVPALKAGLKAAWGKPIVNSVTGEEERMEVVFPLVAERGAVVIAISNDELSLIHISEPTRPY